MSGPLLNSVPLEMLLEQMIHPNRQEMVGCRFRVAHLTSAKGKTLNGKLARVVGFDRTTTEARLHCCVEGNESPIKLKAGNLLPEHTETLLHFMERTPPISNPVLLQCLQESIQGATTETTDRQDLIHRLEIYKKLVEKLQYTTSCLSDKDYCVPCGAGNECLTDNFGVLMNQLKPPCCGDNTVDFRQMHVGLCGDDSTECSICQEVLAYNEHPEGKQQQVLVTLPCLHIFHDQCLTQWLESDIGRLNWNCPACRALAPMQMTTYRIQYREQLQRRINEFLVSGFCAKCQIQIMENNRNETLGQTDDDGNMVVGNILSTQVPGNRSMQEHHGQGGLYH